MPSSLAEPHNYILWETHCLRMPLSLITIEQEGALTGGTRRAAFMLPAHGPPLFSFLLFFQQMAANHTRSNFLWQPGDVEYSIHVQKLRCDCCLGGDVSSTMVSMLFCSESKFQSGHLHALISAANNDFVLSEEEQAAGISMCAESLDFREVLLYVFFISVLAYMKTPCTKVFRLLQYFQVRL